MSMLEIIHEIEAMGGVVITDNDERLVEILDEIGVEDDAGREGWAV